MNSMKMGVDQIVTLTEVQLKEIARKVMEAVSNHDGKAANAAYNAIMHHVVKVGDLRTQK